MSWARCWCPTARRSFLTCVIFFSAGCEPLITSPAGPSPQLDLTLSPSEWLSDAGGSKDYGEVLGHVSEVRLRFIRDGAVRDTVLTVTADDEELHVRADLRPEEARDWLRVDAELAVGIAPPLFAGSGVLRGDIMAPTLVLEVTPVVAYLEGDLSYTTFESLGDTLGLSATARFWTRHRIPGADVDWTSSDPDVVSIASGDRAVPRGNGTAVVSARSGDKNTQKTLTVSQIPESFTGIAPSDTVVTATDSVQMRIFGEDPEGFPLLPGADVTWSVDGPATIDQEGLVSGTGPGDATITAVGAGRTHSARISFAES